MSKEQLPLFNLFLELQQPLKLGLEQYYLLIEALEKGFGYGGFDDIKNLCQTLWLKSHKSEEEKAFHRIFNNYSTKLIPTPKQTKDDREITPTFSKQPETQQPPPNSTAWENNSLQKPSANDLSLPSAYQAAPPMGINHSERGYIFKISDFPFLERAIRQKWRQLRQRVQKGYTNKLDMPKILNLIGRDRICLEPPRQPNWENQLQLLFLEDIEGSMKPFRLIVEELVKTVEPKKFQRVDHYYFRNSIKDFVYLEPDSTEIIYLNELNLKPNASITIIISDAGAARQGYNPTRVELTKSFLEILQPQSKSLIWLNPIPLERWTGTTCEDIALYLNQHMFEFSPPDLNLAIRYAQRGNNG